MACRPCHRRCCSRRWCRFTILKTGTENYWCWPATYYHDKLVNSAWGAKCAQQLSACYKTILFLRYKVYWAIIFADLMMPEMQPLFWLFQPPSRTKLYQIFTLSPPPVWFHCWMMRRDTEADYIIEPRRRHILWAFRLRRRAWPHANGMPTWNFGACRYCQVILPLIYHQLYSLIRRAAILMIIDGAAADREELGHILRDITPTNLFSAYFVTLKNKIYVSAAVYVSLNASF